MASWLLRNAAISRVSIWPNWSLLKLFSMAVLRLAYWLAVSQTT